MKTCKDCGESKPLSEFYLQKGRWPYPRCKACHYVRTQRSRAGRIDTIRAQERARYAANPHIRRNKTLRKYGMKPADFDALMSEQDGRCPVCMGRFDLGSNAALAPRAPVIDHDHETGRVRGLLHRRCNIALETLLELVPDDVLRARAYVARSDQAA